MNQFPVYRQSELLVMPFAEVMHLYDRAVELVSGEKIEYKDASVPEVKTEWAKDINTGRWI